MELNKKYTVIVTSAGTASAISVIKSLRLQKELDLRIVATDMDSLAPGLFLADEFFISPPVTSDQYFVELEKAIKKWNVNVLIPIYSKEIAVIASKKHFFENLGVKTFLASKNDIEFCNDKISINEMLANNGIVVPRNFDIQSEIDTVNFPLFFKPNFSSSSSGTKTIENSSDLENLRRDNLNGILQEKIVAPEVTVDVFCNDKYSPIVISPRLRLAVKSGQAVKAAIIAPEPFIEVVKKICFLTKSIGVCNLQFFMLEDKLIFIGKNLIKITKLAFTFNVL